MFMTEVDQRVESVRMEDALQGKEAPIPAKIDPTFDGAGSACATKSDFAKTLMLILLVGGLARIALWMWFQGEPLHVWDERDYNLLAKNLVVHGEYCFEPGSPTSLRPPLYPALVAGSYALFGLESFQAVRLMQAVLGLLTGLVLCGLGTRVHSKNVGLLLAGLSCFYPSLICQTNLLLTETLFTLLLCLVCYALVLFYQRDSLKYLAAAGVLLGLAALTRSVVWMSPPCLAVIIVITWKAPWRRRFLAPIILLATFAVTLAPWSIRNTMLQGTFVAVDTMGGRNFMMGNYRYTPLYRSWDTISIKGPEAWDHEVASTYPPEMRNSQAKVDQLALRQGLKFVREHPWLTLQRDIIKFFDFWGLEREIVAGAAYGYWGKMPKALIICLGVLIVGSYVAVMFLGIYGMVMAPLADRRLHWLFLLVIAYICAIHTLVFAHSRYHLPIMPVVFLFASISLVNAPDIWRRRTTWRSWLAAGLCCLLFGGWIWNFVAGDAEKVLAILLASA